MVMFIEAKTKGVQEGDVTPNTAEQQLKKNMQFSFIVVIVINLELPITQLLWNR